MVNKEQLFDDTNDLKKLLSDTIPEEKEIEKWQAEIEVVSEVVKKPIQNNATTIQNQEAYERKYQKLSKRFDSAKATLKRQN